MNYYYAGQEEFQGVPFGEPNPSIYQDLIDDYLACGGVVQVIPEGARAKPEFDIEYDSDPRMGVDYPYHSILAGGRKVSLPADLYEGENLGY